MTDSEFIRKEFEMDCREKKRLSYGDKHKVRTTAGGRHVKTASDYMTRKEKLALNGQVHSVNKNKPITYEDFKMLSSDLQAEYLDNLCKKFDPPYDKIASMMGCSKSALKDLIAHNGIKLGKKRGRGHFDSVGWYEFVNSQRVIDFMDAADRDPVVIMNQAEALKQIMSASENQGKTVEEATTEPVTESVQEASPDDRQEELACQIEEHVDACTEEATETLPEASETKDVSFKVGNAEDVTAAFSAVLNAIFGMSKCVRLTLEFERS